MAIHWYYAIHGERYGPITAAQLRELALDGRLTPSDLVWKEGMEKWVPAEAVQGLFAPPSSVPSEAPVLPTEGESNSVLQRVAGRKKKRPRSRKEKVRNPQGEAEPARPQLPASPPKPTARPRPRPRQEKLDLTPWAIIDLSLQRYWTPWILRFTWSIALLGLMLVFLDRTQISLQRLVDTEAQPQSLFIEPIVSAFGSQPPTPRQSPPSPRVQELKSYSVFLILFVLILLWIRVGIESVIVIFNGVMHAKSIDQQLGRAIQQGETQSG